jgi:hypothetical protein
MVAILPSVEAIVLDSPIVAPDAVVEIATNGNGEDKIEEGDDEDEDDEAEGAEVATGGESILSSC